MVIIVTQVYQGVKSPIVWLQLFMESVWRRKPTNMLLACYWTTWCQMSVCITYKPSTIYTKYSLTSSVVITINGMKMSKWAMSEVICTWSGWGWILDEYRITRIQTPALCILTTPQHGNMASCIFAMIIGVPCHSRGQCRPRIWIQYRHVDNTGIKKFSQYSKKAFTRNFSALLVGSA